ncbi:DUF4291 domain-containing protein [Streptomyces griseoluteus]|uniref:DUF4291 domain-containing protein n=1 Tax=Streptomyces griseoluteus TaxID=29306 RepID=A0A4Z1DH06_STRGP|nr:DUF4291 domain-containing protein [Streptomyces griseoluteus]TGN82371.1 DUF4291 domain-containing protein [Streptomyces griseoluteus]GHF09974.1 hypothetical protein GCM10017776_29580 [Streptomyces griseoluteus]
MSSEPPERQVRAAFDKGAVTVYQAYGEQIAEPALRAGTFVDPFRMTRMTWIKPSFLWMMYRCGWGTKPDQERVLALDITREGFEWALANACLSHFDRVRFATEADWREALRVSPVRVQWDPERDLRFNPLPHRAIQIGLSGSAVARYVGDWIVSVRDVTPLAHEVHAAVRAGDDEAARALLPVERPYPLPDELTARIG